MAPISRAASKVVDGCELEFGDLLMRYWYCAADASHSLLGTSFTFIPSFSLVALAISGRQLRVLLEMVVLLLLLLLIVMHSERSVQKLFPAGGSGCPSSLLFSHRPRCSLFAFFIGSLCIIYWDF